MLTEITSLHSLHLKSIIGIPLHLHNCYRDQSQLIKKMFTARAPTYSTISGSGPFDAALNASKSRPNRPSPINAFSYSALDPSLSVSANGADMAPLRDAYPPRIGKGGLSARAKMTLAAMHDTSVSSEDLLASPGRQRIESGQSSPGSSYRWGGQSHDNSEESVTLGFPGQYALNDKGRPLVEAFGVHTEAYEDFGRSAFARIPARASVYPGDRKSGLTPEKRADRTASIWGE